MLIRSLFHAKSNMPIKLVARGGTLINAVPGISINPISRITLGRKNTNERLGRSIHMKRRA
jgi:hypothetical protein